MRRARSGATRRRRRPHVGGLVTRSRWRSRACCSKGWRSLHRHHLRGRAGDGQARRRGGGAAFVIVLAVGTIVRAAAEPRAGEHAEVRGGAAARELRHLLGRRRRRGELAWKRCLSSRDPRAPARLRPDDGHAPATQPREGRKVARSGRSTGVKYIGRFFRFWYDFIVGDDWRVAAGVVAAIGLTALSRIVASPRGG